MKILVIGGAGFIGKPMCDRLSDIGHDVIVGDLDVITENLKCLHLDIMNANETKTVMNKVKPEFIINLASRTDDNGKSVFDYQTNFLGLINLIDAILSESPSSNLFHFSTQYVVRPEKSLDFFLPYFPYTTYGESKAIGEIVLRNSKFSNWTIFRPTAVWGENHKGFEEGLWKLMKRNLFFQSRQEARRSYIYVGTLIEQVYRFLEIDFNQIKGKTFYLGNQPADTRVLMNAFSRELSGRKVLEVPKKMITTLGKLGEAMQIIGIPFPLNKVRSEILTESYDIHLKPTVELIGETPEDLNIAVNSTIKNFLEKKSTFDRR
jgi:GlcNAc-P-P-Und epimerase